MEKLKEVCNANWQLQNNHRDIKYSIRNIVHNILIAMYDARQVFEILRV